MGATLFLDGDNEFQPDILAFDGAAKDPLIRPTPDGFLEGAPPLVVEIAASTASYDLHGKLRA